MFCDKNNINNGNECWDENTGHAHEHIRMHSHTHTSSFNHTQQHMNTQIETWSIP